MKTILRGGLAGYSYIPPRGGTGLPLVKASEEDGDAVWGSVGHVLNYTTSYNAGVSDDTSAIQAAVDAVPSGGTVYLEAVHRVDAPIRITKHCITFAYAGSSSRATSVAAGGRIIYTGTGTAISVEPEQGAVSVHGIQLLNFRIENKANAQTGIKFLNAQNCLAQGVHVRDFKNDQWILQCDTRASNIYNTLFNCSGFRQVTGQPARTAYGLRMLEASGKTVNNNLIMNSYFANNLCGIKQDTACHDNCIAVVDLGSCETGADILGRTTFLAANVESCTTGFRLGGQSAAFGSAHVGSNTTDVDNPDNRPFFVLMQGGDAGSHISLSPRNTGIGFRGQTPPSNGGLNLTDLDGNPSIDLEDEQHIVLSNGGTELPQDVQIGGEAELDGALNHDGTTVGFYGTTPIAKQTGVAVTTAAVHAALVNLGLIGA